MSKDSGNQAGREPGCDNSHLLKYSEDFPRQAYRLCLLGALNKDLAEFFKVNEETIYRWRNEHPEFREALSAGKVEADARVAEALYNRAVGYAHVDTKMFITYGPGEVESEAEEGEGSRRRGATILTQEYMKHYPPDTNACKWWLTNRQRDKWQDKKEIEVTDKTPANGVTESIQGKLDELFDKKPNE